MYKARLHSDSGGRIEVAVKTIREYGQKEMKNFLREMAVMSQLMHPNIIHLHGVVKESKLDSSLCMQILLIILFFFLLFIENWIVLQYFPNKDLKTFLTVRDKNHYYN